MKIRDWPYTTPGLDDHLFIREDAPLTREEVRALTISKLRLTKQSTMIDVGAGTGSVSIEAALQAERGKIWALEKDESRFMILKKNFSQSGLDNLEPINGEAPAAMQELPVVDRVFIGGSGGSLPEIIRRGRELLRPGGLMVLNAVTLETLSKGTEILSELEMEPSVVSLSISKTRARGRYNLFHSLNQIFIISARKGE